MKKKPVRHIKYIYFASYAFSNGFGHTIEVSLSQKITGSAGFFELHGYMSNEAKRSDIIILYFYLLRIERGK